MEESVTLPTVLSTYLFLFIYLFYIYIYILVGYPTIFPLQDRSLTSQTGMTGLQFHNRSNNSIQEALSIRPMSEVHWM